MLASYFRMKYPNVAMAAWASSAPIFEHRDFKMVDDVDAQVSRVYKETNGKCYETLKQSWDLIDKAAAQPSGLDLLSEMFRAAGPLKKFCDDVVSSTKPEGILSSIAEGISNVADSCSSIAEFDSTARPWLWQHSSKTYFCFQMCTELIAPPEHPNNTMFQYNDNEKSFEEVCKDTFGVRPRYHLLTTQYGRHVSFSYNITIVNFLSIHQVQFQINFINFAEHEVVPQKLWQVLENINDSVIALKVNEGSHCLDLELPKKGDPEWLIAHRKKIIDTLKTWIKQYQADAKCL
ncbi:hypothetical protein GIB67_014612 [Kingdonia uniflora]|uniref:Uncharacterized protein n=1 Tax=Kingdonia uniflora TaxID=39325 RepID=A0A7J7NVL1_9MAGN|nr:hypothetical protein GIB67_014612 [Kingdonia uniflora]